MVTGKYVVFTSEDAQRQLDAQCNNPNVAWVALNVGYKRVHTVDAYGKTEVRCSVYYKGKLEHEYLKK